MKTVEKSVLLHYSAKQIFDLVANVEEYPKFLPWCGGTEVLSRDTGGMRATIHIHFKGVRQAFTTRNTHQVPTQIKVELESGPFKALQGEWQFIPLQEQACKVQFRLEYAFSSKLLELAVGPVFSHIAQTFVEAFVQRAEQVYGATA